MSSYSKSPSPIGYLSVMLPLLTIHLCFFFSLYEGYIQLCMPYWLDCTSVSRTGRNGIAYFIFKGGMITTSLLLFITWQITRYWLVTLGLKKSYALFYLPAIASLALLIYTLALGHTGDAFYLMRRFGVVLFMFCSFVSQVIVGKKLLETTEHRKQGRCLVLFSAIILFIAIFSLILDGVLGDAYHRAENAFEWWLIVLLIGHLFLIVRAWDLNRLRLTFTAG